MIDAPSDEYYDAPGFCDEWHAAAGVCCDLPAGHEGDHRERGVAQWNRDCSVIRYAPIHARHAVADSSSSGSAS